MHTYRGAHGLIINYNSDYSGMALVRYRGAEMKVPAEEIRQVVEPVRIVREIVDSDPLVVEPFSGGDLVCCYCRRPAEKITPPEQWRHAADCLFVRARAIVARLDAMPQQSNVVTIEPVYITINGMRRELKPEHVFESEAHIVAYANGMTLEEAEAAGLIIIVRHGEG